MAELLWLVRPATPGISRSGSFQQPPAPPTGLGRRPRFSRSLRDHSDRHRFPFRLPSPIRSLDRPDSLAMDHNRFLQSRIRVSSRCIVPGHVSGRHLGRFSDPSLFH